MLKTKLMITQIVPKKAYTSFCISNLCSRWIPHRLQKSKLNACKTILENASILKESYIKQCFKERAIIIDTKNQFHFRTKEIENELSEILNNNYLRKSRMFLVEGIPFIEDIENHKPSRRIAVSFGKEKTTIDEIYSLFRKYGFIKSIEEKQDKNGAKIIVVIFKDIESAISAKLCLHRFLVNGVSIYVSYFPYKLPLNQYLKNSKLIIILILGLIFGAIYTVSDWIRVLSLITKFKIYHQNSDKEGADPSYTLPVIKKTMLELHNLINQSPNNLIFYCGPLGSGKHHVLQEVLRENKHQLWLNFGELMSLNNSGREILIQLERQIGYFSMFKLIDMGISLIEKGLTLATGTSPDLGSSNNLDSRINSVLNSVTRSLIYLHMKTIKVRSQDIPVIVIDNYHIFRTKHYDVFQKDITQWAADVVEKKLAHVIFVSDHKSSYEKIILTTNNTKIKKLTQKDSSIEDSLKYINLFFPELEKTKTIKNMLNILGGRLSDINVLLKCMQKNVDIGEAVNNITEKTTKDILYNWLNLGFFDTVTNEDVVRTWYLVKKFAKTNKINYNILKESPLFQNKIEVLSQYESKGLLEIIYKDGMAHEIRPSRPILQTCFKKIVENKVISNKLNIIEIKTNIQSLEAEIKSIVSELCDLKDAEIVNRSRYWFFSNNLKRSYYIVNKLNNVQKELSKSEKYLSRLLTQNKEYAKRTNSQ